MDNLNNPEDTYQLRHSVDTLRNAYMLANCPHMEESLVYQANFILDSAFNDGVCETEFWKMLHKYIYDWPLQKTLTEIQCLPTM